MRLETLQFDVTPTHFPVASVCTLRVPARCSPSTPHTSSLEITTLCCTHAPHRDGPSRTPHNPDDHRQTSEGRWSRYELDAVELTEFAGTASQNGAFSNAISLGPKSRPTDPMCRLRAGSGGACREVFSGLSATERPEPSTTTSPRHATRLPTVDQCGSTSEVTGGSGALSAAIDLASPLLRAIDIAAPVGHRRGLGP